MPASTTPAPTARPLLPRQELFAFHAARGASLAQASRLAGYSPQGARQRGSVLMANSDIRLRVEEFRRDWMAERDATVAEAVEETGQVIETALRLNRPTAALKAIELKLKLRGVIHDRRFSLYTDSPDDDLSTCGVLRGGEQLGQRGEFADVGDVPQVVGADERAVVGEPHVHLDAVGTLEEGLGHRDHGVLWAPRARGSPVSEDQDPAVLPPGGQEGVLRQSGCLPVEPRERLVVAGVER